MYDKTHRAPFLIFFLPLSAPSVGGAFADHGRCHTHLQCSPFLSEIADGQWLWRYPCVRLQHWVNKQQRETKSDSLSVWSSFEGAWFGGWVVCVFWETCSEPRWESVWSTGPCVLWPDVWSRWEALWFLAPRDPARLWSGIDALNGSLPFLPEGWTGSQIRFNWKRGCLNRI